MADIEKTIWIDAPVDVVFEHFIDGNKLAAWSGIGARAEPVPGGIYELDMGVVGKLEGQFISVEKPSLVIFEVNPPAGVESPPSRIEVRLKDEAGGTRVNVVQSLVPPFDQVAKRGWDHHLARLSVVVTGGQPGRDTLCERPMDSLLDG